MKFIIRLLTILLITYSITYASDKDTVKADSTSKIVMPWKKKLTGTVTLAQTSYSNWAKGGQNTITWNSRLTGDATRIIGKWNYKFSSLMVFGQTKQEKEKIRNTMDKIDLDASIACKINKFINPEFGIGILTQFSKGYDYKKTPPELKSDFFDPAFLTQSLGGTVKINTVFSSRLGIGLKQTVTRRFPQYSDDPKTEDLEKVKFESGIDSKTDLVNAKLFPNVTVRSKLHLFSSFEHLNVIDMDWDTLFTAKLNAHIVVTLNLLLKYDKDLVDKMQVKETAALGLSYNFISASVD